MPAARALLSGEVEAILAAAVAPFTIGALHPRQVIAKLGSSLTVAFDCELVGPDGTTVERMVVARAGGSPPLDTTMVSNGSEQIAVWAYPHDPWLPGLATLFDPVKTAEWLGPIGLHPTKATPNSYRPGSRAVVELVQGRKRYFAKAVRTRSVNQLEARHRLFSARMSVPESLATSAGAGLLVLDSLPGETMLERLARDPNDVPNGKEIVELLDRMPAFEVPVVSPVEREHATLLALLVPEVAGLVRELASAVRRVAPHPLVPAHGDLHAGQIMISATGRLGLIDIDAAGMGSRGDDLAGLLAHLSALGGHDRLVGALREDFEGVVDPSQLRLRTAAAVLGFAGVPFTNQEPDWPRQVTERIELAETWLGVPTMSPASGGALTLPKLSDTGNEPL